jgi:hypothetical protein
MGWLWLSNKKADRNLSGWAQAWATKAGVIGAGNEPGKVETMKQPVMAKYLTKKEREEKKRECAECAILDYLWELPLSALESFADEVEHLLEKRSELDYYGVRLTGQDLDDFYNDEKELKDLRGKKTSRKVKGDDVLAIMKAQEVN